MNGQDKKFLSRMLECMPHVDGQVIQLWIEDPKMLKHLLAPLSERPPALYSRESFWVYAARLNPLAFFKNQEGLSVTQNFENFLLHDLAEEDPSFLQREISYADVAKVEAPFYNVEKELPPKYAFENGRDFLFCLSQLLRPALEGEDSNLRAEKRNILFVKTRLGKVAAEVAYEPSGNTWCCDVYNSKLKGFSPGTRVFSAAP